MENEINNFTLAGTTTGVILRNFLNKCIKIIGKNIILIIAAPFVFLFGLFLGIIFNRKI